MWARFVDRVDALYEHAQQGGRSSRAAATVLRTIVQLVRQLLHDDCFLSASALSFTTLLSLVPLLAVLFAVLKAFTTSAELTDQVRQWLLSTFLAESVAQVADVLNQALERARGGTIGVVGFVVLMFTAVMLFISIERAFNRIWRVSYSRPLYRRVTTFYAVITLAPALVGLAIYVTAVAQTGLQYLPLGGLIAARVVPWMLEATALTLLYKLLPHARVNWRAAIVAGVVAAVAFDVTKWGFNRYVLAIYAGSVRAVIYGSLALVPMFFLWVYVAWIVVLGGVELGFILQNWRVLNDERVVRRLRLQQGERSQPTGYLTARVFLDVAQQFREHGGGVPLEGVARRLEVSVGELQPVLTLLRDRGFLLTLEEGVAEVEAIPAKPLTRVRVRDVFALPSAQGYRPGDLPAKGSARVIEERLRAAQACIEAALELDVETLLAEAEAAD
jgi:membrane protein